MTSISWRYLAVAALAGFGIGTAQNGVTPPERMKAQSFVLVDESGRKRGEFSMGSNGQPMVRLYDQDGRIIWDTNARVELLTK